jgi:hypothetical protein
VHLDDVAAHELHAEDVQALAADVLRAHVDVAVEAEQGGDGGGRDAVLARAGLGDDAPLAHALGQQCLADRVVDLVRAGVVEVLALAVNLGAAELVGEAAGVVEAGGAADELVQVVVELGVERRVALGTVVLGGELLDGGDEGLGDVDAAVRPEVAGGVGEGGNG